MLVYAVLSRPILSVPRAPKESRREMETASVEVQRDRETTGRKKTDR